METLIEDLENAADPRTRETARELMQTVLELHATGLRNIIEYIQRSESAEQILAACAENDLVSNMLMLHNLHPLPLHVRVQEIVRNLQPVLRAHGAEVEIVHADEEAVRVRLVVGTAAVASLRPFLEEGFAEALPDTSTVIIEEALRPVAGEEAGRLSLPVVAQFERSEFRSTERSHET